MTDAVVLEGQLKWREGKKWKSRWLVLRKPSPVADCLLLLVYKERAERLRGLKERNSVTLEDICGLDPGLCYEGLTHTLAIICLTQVVMLGFESKETMHTWDTHIRYSLGEVHRFHVVVAPGTKLESGPATLHFCNDILVLVNDVPPVIMGQWKLSDLRRYGAVPNGFVFEGGTRCGFWAGVFFLSCTEGEKISFLFDCIVHGISPTKGFRRVLADPNPSPACMEERVAYEASKLEKRLSLLSHGCHGSGGDDRSLSSASSDTSCSDASIGSRLTLWPEQSSAGTSQESRGLVAAATAEKLQSDGAQGASKPPPSLLRSRQLQEIGRQSSSDSGIATGSHSSYSGSFSSYAGSLDICHGDEFGSLLSLSLSFPSDRNVCSCLPGEPGRSPGPDYQAPSWLWHTYDTPRSLFAASTTGILASPPDTGLSKAQTSKGDVKWPAPHLERDPSPGQTRKRTRRASSHREAPKAPSRRHSSGSWSRARTGEGPRLLRVSQAVLVSCAAPFRGEAGSLPSLPSLWRDTELSLSEQLHGDMATYVNIPTSPTAKKQLHYMEVELQEPSGSVRGSDTTKYAQIDITATETAHKVGTQHAHFREERLQELEKKDGGPPGSS
uniref:Docking protein 7 n=1 Tax=Naja naja TaxID=35670 RepID=A0A8C6Y469_NAJNA